VVGQGRASEVIDAVGDAFQHPPVSSEPIEGGRGDASALSLAPRDETPLILGDLSNGSASSTVWHYCILSHI
jgi:hypothetical protein